MPLFYFHLRNPKGLDRDQIGLELTDLDAAYLEACHSVPEMSADLVRKKLNPVRYTFEIADDSDRLLIEVPFSEVLDHGRRPVAPPKTLPTPMASDQMARAAYLIRTLRAEQAATRLKLAETRRLLAALRSVSVVDQGPKASSEA